MSCREKGQYPDEEIELHYQGESNWLLWQYDKKDNIWNQRIHWIFSTFSIYLMGSNGNTQESNKDKAEDSDLKNQGLGHSTW